MPNIVRRVQQNCKVIVSSLATSHPLFRARVAENTDSSGIYLESIAGTESFGSVLTEAVWTSTSGGKPALLLSQASGQAYATIKQGYQGNYEVMHGVTVLAIFSGDFRRHDVQVCDRDGQTMAWVSQAREDKYQVVVFPRVDAGLIILSLLAIDKIERR